MGKKLLLNTGITIMLFVSFLCLLLSFDEKNWLNVSLSAIVFVAVLIVKVIYIRRVHKALKQRNN